MNKNEIIQKIEALSNEIEKPDLKKTEALITETLKFFEHVREKLQSPDEADRKAALEEIQEVQKKLEELAQKALQIAGINPEQIAGIVSNPKNFSPSDWSKIQHIQDNIEKNSKTTHIKP